MTSASTFPQRLTKIDDLTRPDHFYLTPEDACYFLGEYTARKGYAFSPTNQLVLNFASSRDRVGDFHRFSISCLLLFLLNAVGMWATRLRCPSCPRRCPHARIVDRSARLCLADVHQDNKRRLQFWGQNRYRAGSMQVRILSRRYSWSRKP
jgi:hypothetical protein